MSCCGHGGDHEHVDPDHAGAGSTLLDSIDIDGVRCLNERTPNCCQGVFRAWDERGVEIPEEKALLSDEDDPELLLFVPFLTQANIRAFTIVGGSQETAPAKCRIYVNRDDLDFSSVADLKPVQEFDLVTDPNIAKDIQYPLKPSKFTNASSVAMHFPDVSEADYSRIDFISFRGDATKNKREAVAAVYEARAIPKDHKTQADAFPSHSIQ